MENELKLKMVRGSDANVKFEIVSTSPGVSAKFSDDGRKLLTKGKVMSPLELSMMTIQVMLEKFVRSITIAGTKWRKERKNMVKKLIQLT